MQNFGVVKTITNVEVQNEQLTNAMEDILFLLFLWEAIKDNLNNYFLLKNEARRKLIWVISTPWQFAVIVCGGLT